MLLDCLKYYTRQSSPSEFERNWYSTNRLQLAYSPEVKVCCQEIARHSQISIQYILLDILNTCMSIVCYSIKQTIVLHLLIYSGFNPGEGAGGHLLPQESPLPLKQFEIRQYQLFEREHNPITPTSFASLALYCPCMCTQSPFNFLEKFIMPPQGHTSRLSPVYCMYFHLTFDSTLFLRFSFLPYLQRDFLFTTFCMPRLWMSLVRAQSQLALTSLICIQGKNSPCQRSPSLCQ